MKRKSEGKLSKCAENKIGQTVLPWWDTLIIGEGICRLEKEDYRVSLYHP